MIQHLCYLRLDNGQPLVIGAINHKARPLNGAWIQGYSKLLAHTRLFPNPTAASS